MMMGMRRNPRSVAPVLLPGLLALAACAAPSADGTPAAPETPRAATPAAEASLRGRVMRDGGPVVGLVVALYAPPPKNTSIDQRCPIATAVADEHGYYAFREPVAPGEYVLRLEDHQLRKELFEGSQPGYVVQQPLFVARDQQLPPFDFVLR